MISLTTLAQEEKKDSDTTRIKLSKREIIIVDKDTIDASGDWSDKHDGRWDGIDFGPTILLNGSGGSSFPLDPQWENDPAKSFYWNLNFFDHRFQVYKHVFGITTGLGVNFTQIGIRNNKILLENSDSLWVVSDTINNYKKNKLRATYLQVPLLFEFNTNSDEDKAFYFAVGAIGGVRVGSALIQKIDSDKIKVKGDYALNPFKLDATFRMGYGDWGLFANYALLPLFETSKTSVVYPFTFGASLNF
ncbi:MAG: outer membrane beta-barrel protein [Flavobacteriia bacterium]|nr:outer membrane beta-barrel protein [Flavobacteriia bacterium]